MYSSGNGAPNMPAWAPQGQPLTAGPVGGSGLMGQLTGGGGVQMSGQSPGALLPAMTPYNSGQYNQPAPQGSSFMSALGMLGMPNTGGSGLMGQLTGGGGVQTPPPGGPAQNIQQILAGLGAPQPGGFRPGAERQHNLGQLAARYGMPQAPAWLGRLPPHIARMMPNRFPRAPRPGALLPAMTPYNSGQYNQPAPQGSSFMSALGMLGMPNTGGAQMSGQSPGVGFPAAPAATPTKPMDVGMTPSSRYLGNQPAMLGGDY